MPIVLATNNAHKVREIREILGAAGIQDEVLSLDDFPEIPEPPEEQDTFAGNALQKARFVFAHLGMTAVADDSGIAVDALGGAPGVYSKRFTPEKTAQSNNARLLRELAQTPDDQRTARFVCAMAVVSAHGEQVAEATCEGRIAHAPRGQGGFGYDPLFLPDETPGRTMAELSADEKHAISHRGRAFAQLPAVLRALGLSAD